MKFDDLLIKPHIEPYDSNTQRIRRNLLAASLLGIVMTLGSASFDGNHSGLFGVKLEQISVRHFYYLLLASLSYFSVHFTWASIDTAKANYFRLTGIKVPMATVGTYMAESTFEPNVVDNNNSSLFSWWKGQRQHSEHLQKLIENIEANAQEAKYESALNSSKQFLENMNQKAEYLEAALLKFESGYWEYQRSQVIRWYLLDFGIPLLLSLISVALVVNELLVSA